MWFFFYAEDIVPEVQDDLLPESAAAPVFDPEIAKVLEVIIYRSREPIGRDGRNQQYGTEKMHKGLFDVVAYNMRGRMHQFDWYDILVRFHDGYFQWVIVDLYHDRFKQPFSSSIHSASEVLLKDPFVSEEIRQEFAVWIEPRKIFK